MHVRILWTKEAGPLDVIGFPEDFRCLLPELPLLLTCPCFVSLSSLFHCIFHRLQIHWVCGLAPRSPLRTPGDGAFLGRLAPPPRQWTAAHETPRAGESSST